MESKFGDTVSTSGYSSNSGGSGVIDPELSLMHKLLSDENYDDIDNISSSGGGGSGGGGDNNEDDWPIEYRVLNTTTTDTTGGNGRRSIYDTTSGSSGGGGYGSGSIYDGFQPYSILHPTPQNQSKFGIPVMPEIRRNIALVYGIQNNDISSSSSGGGNDDILSSKTSFEALVDSYSVSYKNNKSTTASTTTPTTSTTTNITNDSILDLRITSASSSSGGRRIIKNAFDKNNPLFDRISQVSVV